jgi:hypothetical protein
MDPQFLGKTLAEAPFFAPLETVLSKTGMFDGDAKLVRLKVDFDLADRSVGRTFDLWPILTGTDEILVHGVGYPCAASRRETGRIGPRLLECVTVPVEGAKMMARRQA